MFDVAKAPGTSRVWAVGRAGLRLNGGVTGVVETINPSGSSTATAPAQEGSGTPTESSAQVPQQPELDADRGHRLEYIGGGDLQRGTGKRR